MICKLTLAVGCTIRTLPQQTRNKQLMFALLDCMHETWPQFISNINNFFTIWKVLRLKYYIFFRKIIQKRRYA